MSELCWKCHVLCATRTAASDSHRGVVVNGLLFSNSIISHRYLFSYSYVRYSPSYFHGGQCGYKSCHYPHNTFNQSHVMDTAGDIRVVGQDIFDALMIRLWIQIKNLTYRLFNFVLHVILLLLINDIEATYPRPRWCLNRQKAIGSCWIKQRAYNRTEYSQDVEY